MSAEMKETVERISCRPDVSGVMLINSEGIPLETTMGPEQTVGQYEITRSAKQFVMKLGVFQLSFCFCLSRR